jgi:choice-of-anchor A domain-containing protein
MRSVVRRCFPLPLAIALWPSIGMAAEPHSWCITGDPMIQGGGDSYTNAVVSYVCSLQGYDVCCSSKWTLSCVQKGAAWALLQNLDGKGGDICGRYAWTQGPLPNTQQYYPRDFNLLTLGDDQNPGNANGFQDVQGPVAVNGDVATAGFYLNSGKHETVALVAQGNVKFASGTIHGSLFYGGKSYDDSGTTSYFDGQAPTSPSSPLDFAKTRKKLLDMTSAVGAYGTTKGATAVKSNQTLTLKGTDLELNVFNIASSGSNDVVTGTTQYTFNVPTNSAIIVNVTGTGPVIKSAGFTSPTFPGRILWNFPEATTLQTGSSVMPGSILAPKAVANLNYGQIDGTVVVKSGYPVFSELHWAPYQMPSCGGCLCLDATWSCSGDTALNDYATASILSAEAGFMQIDGGHYWSPASNFVPYPSQGVQRTSPTHRIWYSFQPADAYPEKAPLVVFFNGGPGSPTSPIMFSFNTAPWTLDPQVVGNSLPPIVHNPNSWTQFANLLYIDAPGTGFSYPVKLPDGSQPTIGLDMHHEAGIFLRLLFRFLARHPALLANQIILTGESYGGTRATLMLNHLLNYGSLPVTGTSSPAYQDQPLYDELLAHFQAIYGTGTSISINMIAAQFSHQVLIEPMLIGSSQFTQSYNNQDTSMCSKSSRDTYNCDEGSNWSSQLIATAATNLTRIGNLTQALRVNPRTIDWMKPAFRQNAYGRTPPVPDDSTNPTIVQSTPDLVTAFGALNSDDNYFLLYSSAVHTQYKDSNGYAMNYSNAWQSLGYDFLNDVTWVHTFITHAEYDTAVWSPGIFLALNNGSDFSDQIDMNLGGAVTSTPAPSVANPRPDYVTLNYKWGQQHTIRFPYYGQSSNPSIPSAAAGHTVVMRAPTSLLNDVTQWFETTQGSP